MAISAIIATVQPHLAGPRLPAHANDPSGAKRPPNAFILFCQCVRPDVERMTPGLNNIQYTKIMADMWRATPEIEKARFKSAAAGLQIEFKRRYPHYGYKKAARAQPMGRPTTLGKLPQPLPKAVSPPPIETRWEDIADNDTAGELDRFLF
jgi:hypothetical protein